MISEDAPIELYIAGLTFRGGISMPSRIAVQ
jgi:hypothetical protein